MGAGFLDVACEASKWLDDFQRAHGLLLAAVGYRGFPPVAFTVLLRLVVDDAEGVVELLQFELHVCDRHAARPEGVNWSDRKRGVG